MKQVIPRIRDKGSNYKGKILYRCMFICPYCNREVFKYITAGKIAKSCGCVRYNLISNANTKHGYSVKDSRLYDLWVTMRQRCNNSKRNEYQYYGERGISVDKEFDDFTVFRNFALNNGYTNNLTIDRINNDGNYERSNIQFITISENVKKMHRDKREANGI